MLRSLVMFLVVLVLGAAAGRAEAQVLLSPSTAPVLGSTVRGTTATTFSISTTGTVTRLSGDAIRVSSGSVTAPTVSFSCGLLNLGGLCALRPLRVTIAPTAGSPAVINRFRISNLSGTTYRSGSAPAEASILVFELNALGLFATGSFHLGMDVVVNGGAASGPHTFLYTVTVELI